MTVLRVEPAAEIDAGYFEWRVNWTAEALVKMTGNQVERFQTATREIEKIEEELDG